jgi:hypothetical protein
LGKFEGDPFETVYLRVDQSTNHLLVLTEAGEVADFDLNVQSYVFEDTQDPSCFILDHRKIIVVFKLDSVDTFNGVMKQMPPVVFMVAELSEAEQKLLKGLLVVCSFIHEINLLLLQRKRLARPRQFCQCELAP